MDQRSREKGQATQAMAGPDPLTLFIKCTPTLVVGQQGAAQSQHPRSIHVLASNLGGRRDCPNQCRKAAGRLWLRRPGQSRTQLLPGGCTLYVSFSVSISLSLSLSPWEPEPRSMKPSFPEATRLQWPRGESPERVVPGRLYQPQLLESSQLRCSHPSEQPQVPPGEDSAEHS